MKPRLVAIYGPLQGETYDIPERGIIGRGADWIAIDDSSVSRRHSEMIREGEAIQIRDLDSRNGTFVAGVPIKSKRLRHGDQIQIGNSLFAFLCDDTSPA